MTNAISRILLHPTDLLTIFLFWIVLGLINYLYFNPFLFMKNTINGSYFVSIVCSSDDSTIERMTIDTHISSPNALLALFRVLFSLSDLRCVHAITVVPDL